MKPKTRSARVRVRLLFGCAAACVGCLGAVFLWMWRCLRRAPNKTGTVLLAGGAACLALTALLVWFFSSARRRREQYAQRELERANRDMREIQLQKRKEQLNALQNQINPHFLYNTLDTIRGLAIERGAMDVADIVATLSSMFKYSMDYANSLVPVSDELEHLNSFLRIQAIRFPRKFTFEQRMECEFRDLNRVRIPKLVLQPIVENVFTHAFRRMLFGGRIVLRLVASEEEFQILVTDNGAGMRDEQVLAMNRMFRACEPERHSDGGHSSIALSNIDARIKMYCGERYGLYIASTPDYGTTVTVSLAWPESLPERASPAGEREP